MIQSWLVARESEGEVKEIASVWAPVPARVISAVSKKERTSRLTVKGRYLPNSEGKMGLDSMVILKKRQQKKAGIRGSAESYKSSAGMEAKFTNRERAFRRGVKQ